jgi:hypothetical protein
MGIPDEWSSIVFGRGQNPAYRPSGFFIYIKRLGDGWIDQVGHHACDLTRLFLCPRFRRAPGFIGVN